MSKATGVSPDLSNLFAQLPALPQAEEQFDTLLSRPGLKIERIVSTGQASPPGFWYEQPQAEWVLLLQGEAWLEIAGAATPHHLSPGDFLFLPPRLRHRVAATAAENTTVWLAIHFDETCPPA